MVSARAWALLTLSNHLGRAQRPRCGVATKRDRNYATCGTFLNPLRHSPAVPAGARKVRLLTGIGILLSLGAYKGRMKSEAPP